MPIWSRKKNPTVAVTQSQVQTPPHQPAWPLVEGSSGKAWLVSATNAEADFGCLQDAIDAASPMDTIRIGAGVYREDFIVSKPLHFLGEMSSPSGLSSIARSVLMVPDESFFAWSWSQPGGSFNNIRFVAPPEAATYGISEDGMVGFVWVGGGSNLTLRKCSFEGPSDRTVEVTDDSTLTISECMFSSDSTNPMLVTGRSVVRIHNTVLRLEAAPDSMEFWERQILIHNSSIEVVNSEISFPLSVSRFDSSGAVPRLVAINSVLGYVQCRDASINLEKSRVSDVVLSSKAPTKCEIADCDIGPSAIDPSRWALYLNDRNGSVNVQGSRFVGVAMASIGTVPSVLLEECTFNGNGTSESPLSLTGDEGEVHMVKCAFDDYASPDFVDKSSWSASQPRTKLFINGQEIQP